MAEAGRGAEKLAGWEPVALPEFLVAKIEPWFEYRMGVKRVAVVLEDGRIFKPAFVSGTAIQKVGPADEPFAPIPFSTEQIEDVLEDWSD